MHYHEENKKIVTSVLLTDEWINKMRMRKSHSQSISGTVKYSPAMKRNEVLRPAPTWMNPGNVRQARGWSPRTMYVE